VVLVVIAGSHTRPGPALHGRGLAVLLSLVGFGAGVLGVAATRRARVGVQAPFFILLVVAAAVLAGVQPRGPAYVGVFIAVAIAAMRVGGWLEIVVVVVAVASLAIASALSNDQSLISLLLLELGVAAFYATARLSRRLREEEEQAHQLLVELDRHREAEARSAVLGERQRLAREMHDVLAHTLSGLVVQLEGVRLLAARGGVAGDVADGIDRSQRLARAGLDEAKRAIGMLRDEELPGPERLPSLADEFSRDSGIPCSAATTGTVHELSPEARLTVYRVAQEALTNVRKHAEPARVELELAYEPGGARLTVEDIADSARAVATFDDNGGYGLTGMRERADLIGGTLVAEPTERGFRVELWVPA
jgi:signal transduction histidine kinase